MPFLDVEAEASGWALLKRELRGPIEHCAPIDCKSREGWLPRILVVERSDALRSRLSGVLADLMPAAKVVEVSTGFEALRALPLQRFDLLVVDVRLPDIDGCDFLGFVRSHRNYLGIPLVLISDDALRIDRITGIRVEGWLCEPFEDEELRDILAELLEDCAMAQILSDSAWGMEA